MSSESWEEEFDNRFVGKITPAGYLRMIGETLSERCAHADWLYERDKSIKSFIQTLLEAERKTMLHEVNQVFCDGLSSGLTLEYLKDMSDTMAKREARTQAIQECLKVVEGMKKQSYECSGHWEQTNWSTSKWIKKYCSKDVPCVTFEKETQEIIHQALNDIENEIRKML